MKRWHSEISLMTRRWRQELANHDFEYGQNYPHCYLAPPSDAKGISCHCAHGVGTMRKRTPYGCGNPRCGICHFSKYFVPKARANKKRKAINFELAAY
jgi:hypothetical protein